MAVVEANPDLKCKLVFQSVGVDGTTTRTRTFGNLAVSASNDAIMSGMSALSGLLAEAPVQIVRIDEAELVNE